MWQALRLGSAAQDRHVTHYACLALASATDQAPANVDRVAALVRLGGSVPPPSPAAAGAARLPGAGGEGGAALGQPSPEKAYSITVPSDRAGE